MAHLGEEIRKVVEAKGFSVIELAQHLGVDRNNVYNIFKREHIHTEILDKLSKYVGYNFYEIINKEMRESLPYDPNGPLPAIEDLPRLVAQLAKRVNELEKELKEAKQSIRQQQAV